MTSFFSIVFAALVFLPQIGSAQEKYIALVTYESGCVVTNPFTEEYEIKLEGNSFVGEFPQKIETTFCTHEITQIKIYHDNGDERTLIGTMDPGSYGKQ